MSILHVLKTAVLLMIGAAAIGSVGYDAHRRQVAAIQQQASVEASKLKADADSAWAAYYASAEEAEAKIQILKRKLSDAEGLYQAMIQPPIVNPDPMTATMKLSIAGGGHGSGTHIGGGYVITAGHVAENEGDKLTARFEDGTERKAVTLWSNHTYDIALLKIDGTDIPASQLECRTPTVGEHLRFLGNPLAMEWITTSGYVAGPVTHAYPEAWDTVLPVDAALAGGMSGGGTFDDDGSLVGVNVGIPIQPMGYSGTATGISFVVPGEVVCGLLARTS